MYKDIPGFPGYRIGDDGTVLISAELRSFIYQRDQLVEKVNNLSAEAKRLADEAAYAEAFEAGVERLKAVADTCPHCKGRGSNAIPNGWTDWSTCSRCGGTGRVKP